VRVAARRAERAAVPPGSEGLELDRKTAVAKVRFVRKVRFWGACPVLRI
jgi:hypothetical protein